MNSSELNYSAIRDVFFELAHEQAGTFTENCDTSTLSLKLKNINIHYLWGNRDVGITSDKDMKFIGATPDTLKERILTTIEEL